MLHILLKIEFIFWKSLILNLNEGWILPVKTIVIKLPIVYVPIKSNLFIMRDSY